MADEKRRLIYELLVEAKGLKAQQQEMKSFADQTKQIGSAIKGAAAALGVGFTVKGIAEALSEVQKFREQLSTLGISGTAATAGLQDVQDIAFSTGQSIAAVSEVYQEAIEATQQLGGSQADAAKLAEAFTRAAVAEGKSAQDAAQQLQTLQFAIDKNNVKTKEFVGLLKTSETFQQAAQQALGKTTEELVKMAEAGKINADELTKVIGKFEEIAGQEEIGVTLDRVIESVATLGKTFVASIAQASGLSETLATAVNGGGLKDFLDWVRRAGEMLGGLLRILFNLTEAVGQFGIMLSQIILDPTNIGEIFDVFVQQQKENIEDLKAAATQIENAFNNTGRIETSTDALTDPATIARMNAQRAAAQKAADDAAALKAKEKADRDAERAASAAERQAREDQRELIREAEAAGRERLEAAEAVAEQEKQIRDYIEESAEASRDMVDAMEAPEIPGLTEEFAKQAALVDDIASTLEGAFTELFTGGIRNARQFFSVVLQGIAQILAQSAASDAVGWLKGLVPAAKGEVFDHGALVPFARGGVVSGPTTFPMRDGRTGVMGEAGAEAVMPLRRMRDGRLGVGAASPNVQIVNNTGVAAKAHVGIRNDRLSIVLEAAELGANMAEDRFARSMRSGYGSAAKSIQGTYNLRRSL